MACHYLGTGKKNLMAGATLVFLDESGYSLTPFVRRTWAPVGTVPVLRHSCGTWRKLSAISAVTVKYRKGELQTNLYFRLHPDKAIRTDEVVKFLYSLSRHIKGDIILICDNLKPHHSKKVKKFLDVHPRFQIEFLPPYCPELNPDEGVWNWTKTEDLANICATDTEEMTSLVRGSLRKMQHRKNLLLWCLKNTELPWKLLHD